MIKFDKNKVIDANQEKEDLNQLFKDSAREQSKFIPEPKKYIEYPKPINERKKLIEDIKESLLIELDLKVKVQTEIYALFQTGAFLEGVKKDLLKFISAEVRCQVRDFNLHDSASKLIKEKVETNFNSLTEEVCKRTISKIANKMTKEVNIIREMSHSLNSEIRHISMKIPVSPSYEKEITDYIKKSIDKTSFKELNLMIANQE